VRTGISLASQQHLAANHVNMRARHALMSSTSSSAVSSAASLTWIIGGAQSSRRTFAASASASDESEAVKTDQEEGKAEEIVEEVAAAAATTPTTAETGIAHERALIVMHLAYSTGDDDLEDVFSKVGEVDNVQVMRYSDGKSRGFGVVQMADTDGADRALDTINGIEVNGRELALFRSSEEAFDLGNRTIMVLGLAWAVTSEGLASHFSAAGEVEDAEVKYRPDGLSRGFGWVRMTNHENAAKALEMMHGDELEGRAIRLDWSKPVVSGGGRTYKAPRQNNKYERGDLHLPNKLFVANLPREVDDAQLLAEFEEHAGPVNSANVIRFRDTNISRGFGFVVMADEKGFEQALEKAGGGWNLDGRVLDIKPPQF